MSVTDIPNFEELSDLQRVELAEELFASLRNPEALPAPVTHRLVLEARWAEYTKNPSNVLSEEQFWAQVRTLKEWSFPS